VVEPKIGPEISDGSEKRVGETVDFVSGGENNDKSKDDDGPETRQKAVAIKDSSHKQTMPHVVAAGQGTFAEQILQIAWANNIKVREDADLVEILSAIDVDSEIPIEAFAAVAEILAYVYRANAGEIPIENSNKVKDDEK